MKKTVALILSASAALMLAGCNNAKSAAKSGASSAQNTAETENTGAAGVPFITLSNGVRMPQFGLGTYAQPSDEVCYESTLTALRDGYRHIDTAHAYYDERGVGRAVRQFCKESGVARSEIWITSKLWPSEYGEGITAEAIDKMLSRLQIDYIDLLYVHQPAGDFVGAWKEMERTYEAGKIRALGISNFDVDDEPFDMIMEAAIIKPHVAQIEMHPYAQRKTFREKAAAHGITIEGWFPLGHGDSGLLSDSTIRAIGEAHGKTNAQIILRWHIQEGFSTIPGSKNPDHIKENISIFDFSLNDEEMAAMRALDGERRFWNATYEQTKQFVNTLRVDD